MTHAQSNTVSPIGCATGKTISILRNSFITTVACSLPSATSLSLRETSKLIGQDLDRHVAIEPGVSGTIDLAHAALAELGGDPVMGADDVDHGGSVTDSSGRVLALTYPFGQSAIQPMSGPSATPTPDLPLRWPTGSDGM